MGAFALLCLVASILANAGLIWTAKWNELKGGDATAFTFVLFTVASFITACWSFVTGALAATGADARVIGLGILPGAFSAIAFAALVASFHYGHSGLSSVVASLHIAVPVVVGIIGFGEIPGMPESVALVLIFLSLFLVLGYRYLQERRADQPVQGTSRWIVCALLALLFNGLCLSSMGLWARWVPDVDQAFLMTCYYVAGTVVLAALLLTSRKRPSKAAWMSGSLAALASMTGVFTLTLALRMPDTPISLFVPANVSGYTFVAMVGAELIFRERATPVEWVGAALSIIGILILSVYRAGPS
jgi:drug/metabolite transporter (DMT)-like permease